MARAGRRAAFVADRSGRLGECSAGACREPPGADVRTGAPSTGWHESGAVPLRSADKSPERNDGLPPPPAAIVRMRRLPWAHINAIEDLIDGLGADLGVELAAESGEGSTE